jgi:hypothetical protein
MKHLGNLLIDMKKTFINVACMFSGFVCKQQKVARRMGKVVLLDGALVMKRVTLIIVFLLMGLCVFAQTENDFDITQNAKGTITITGYHGTAMDVTIPATIEGISVTEIGARAFRGKGITSVNIPNSIETIGEEAFFNTKMTNVTIPNSVTKIGKNAFNGGRNYKGIMGKINKLVISNNLAAIPVGAFENNQIVAIEIPLSVISIEDDAFRSNQLSSVVIPDNVKTIGEGAFKDNQLTSVLFGQKVNSIGNDAFANNKLTTILLPETLTTISGGVFQNNLLTSIIIPNSVTSVYGKAFADNKELDSVTIISSSTTFHGSGSDAWYDTVPFLNCPIVNITLPANFDLRMMQYGRRSSRSTDVLFQNNFATFYESQNKKAGTYSWSGRLWSVK